MKVMSISVFLFGVSVGMLVCALITDHPSSPAPQRTITLPTVVDRGVDYCYISEGKTQNPHDPMAPDIHYHALWGHVPGSTMKLEDHVIANDAIEGQQDLVAIARQHNCPLKEDPWK